MFISPDVLSGRKIVLTVKKGIAKIMEDSVSIPENERVGGNRHED